MKTQLSLLICLATLLGACKKTQVQPTTNSAAIKGTWELRVTRGGNMVPGINPQLYPQGNGHIVSFGSTTFALYSAHTLIESGSYAPSPNSQSQYTISGMDNNATYINEAIIIKDTLELIPGNPDVASSFFVKTSNQPLAN